MKLYKRIWKWTEGTVAVLALICCLAAPVTALDRYDYVLDITDRIKEIVFSNKYIADFTFYVSQKVAY